MEEKKDLQDSSKKDKNIQDNLTKNKAQTIDAATFAFLNSQGNSIIAKLSGPTLQEQSDSTKKAIQDAYQNSVLAIGQKDVIESFTNYGFSNDTLNWSLWLALYNDSWLFRKCIDKPSQDIVGHGFQLKGNADFNNVYKVEEMLRPSLSEFVQWGKLFGGSIAVMMFNHVKFDYMYNSINKAFDEKLITEDSVIKLYVSDRWYGVAPSTETVTDMKSVHFGKPKYYNITFADGKSYRIHHSWVLRFENRTAPNLVKRGMLQGWGYAEGAHLINELSRDDKLKSSIHSLVNKSLIEVIKMSGMRGVFMGSDVNNQEQLQKRLEMVNWGRSYNSLTFLDKDDEYQQNTFSGLTGLADLLEKNMWLVAAALDMSGILFGDLKGGFSTDTEALVRYDEVIQNQKNAYYRGPLTQLLSVLYKMYGLTAKVEFTFNSLIVKKDTDKLDDIQKYGGFLSTMIADGVMTPQQVARAIRSYSKQVGLDLFISDEDIEKLKDTVAEEMENIDLDEDKYTDADDIEEKEKPKDTKKFKLFKKKQKDSFIEDMSHVKRLEDKWTALYPSLRIAWYEVDAKKQALSDITLYPSLYIFSDKNPVRQGNDASNSSIRFSNHKGYFTCRKTIIIKNFDRTIYEQEADRYIANNQKLMKELYGH